MKMKNKKIQQMIAQAGVKTAYIAHLSPGGCETCLWSKAQFKSDDEAIEKIKEFHGSCLWAVSKCMYNTIYESE